MYDRYGRYPSYGEVSQGNSSYMNNNRMDTRNNDRLMYNTGSPYTRFSDTGRSRLLSILKK